MTIACSVRDAPHMNSKCYLDWIEKKAQQILEKSKKRRDRRK